MSPELLFSICSTIVSALAAGVYGLTNWTDRHVKAVVAVEIKSVEKDVNNIRPILAEHAAKIAHFERTVEKHDDRITRIETRIFKS